MRVVSVLNLKGGVGTTTVVSHLCPALVDLLRRRHGPQARVLVVDATTGCGATWMLAGIDSRGLTANVATVVTGRHSVREAAIALDRSGSKLACSAEARDGVSLLPASELARVRVRGREGFSVLRELLTDRDELPEGTELVLVDCGNSDTDLTELGILAADDLVAIVTPNGVDVHGLNLLLHKIRRLQARFGQVQDLAGVVVNRFSRGDVADEEVLNDLEDHLGPRLWEPVLPSSGAIKRANNQHLPITHYRPPQPALVAAFAALAAHLIPDTARHRSQED